MPDIETEVSNFLAEKAKLFNGNSQPIHVPEEHTQRLATLQAGLQSTLDQITGPLDAQITAIRSQITALEGKNTLDQLTPAELETANARREFLKEDISLVSLADLSSRLKALVADGKDKAGLFLYARYLPARLDAENGKPQTPAHRQALGELWQLQRAAQQKLNPSQEAEINKLRSQIEEAQLKRARASRLVMDVTTHRTKVRL